MQHSESLANLAAALAAAQAEIDNVTKDAKNPHYKSSYATLAAITDTTRPVLTKHGLAVVQLPGFADGVVTVETILTHKSGEWLSGVAGAPIGKADAQGVGSACTYLRRYSLAALCNIAQEDDDGEGAVRRTEDRERGNSRAAVPGTSNATGTRRPSTPTGANGSGKRAEDRTMPIGNTKGTKLGDIPSEALAGAIQWCRGKDAEKWADLIRDCETVILNRDAQ